MTALLVHVPRLRRWLPALIVAVLAGGLWSAQTSSAATHAVDARDFAFQPAEMSVQVGDTVTWTNRDAEAHAVQGGAMSSPDIQPGGSFSHTFNEPGDVTYMCRLHTYMTGVIHVGTGGGTPTTTRPPSTTTTRPPTTTTTRPPTPTTSSTVPGETTTTSSTVPGETTTTSSTVPGETTTTSTTAPPPSGGGRPFQDVPDDPSASYPPGHPRANDAPPAGSGSTSTSSTTSTSRAPRPFQDVPLEPFRAGAQPTQALLASLLAADADERPTGDLGDGTTLAPFEERDGVKVFRLTMDETEIEVAPGVRKAAYAFNGTVPGPVLRVNEGDRVRIIVDNQLPFSTSVHWHGMILPNDQDGVAGITQQGIEPGDTYVYEWTAEATGTHWYHSHSSGRHIGKGLFGALEVVPKVGDIKADRDYRVMLGDTDLGFTLNGRSFPSTPTLAAAVGETVRLRVINAGDQVHAMHLHGTPFRVVAQDGIMRQLPEGMDTVTVSPGQTYDLVATMPSAGPWLFHCHIFGHSHESMDEHPAGHTGMTGMVLVINVVEDAAGLLDPILEPLSTAPISSRRLPPGADVAFVAAMAALVVAVGTPLVRRRPTALLPLTKETR